MLLRKKPLNGSEIQVVHGTISFQLQALPLSFVKNALIS